MEPLLYLKRLHAYTVRFRFNWNCFTIAKCWSEFSVRAHLKPVWGRLCLRLFLLVEQSRSIEIILPGTSGRTVTAAPLVEYRLLNTAWRWDPGHTKTLFTCYWNYVSVHKNWSNTALTNAEQSGGGAFVWTSPTEKEQSGARSRSVLCTSNRNARPSKRGFVNITHIPLDNLYRPRHLRMQRIGQNVLKRKFEQSHHIAPIFNARHGNKFSSNGNFIPYRTPCSPNPLMISFHKGKLRRGTRFFTKTKQLAIWAITIQKTKETNQKSEIFLHKERNSSHKHIP